MVYKEIDKDQMLCWDHICEEGNTSEPPDEIVRSLRPGNNRSPSVCMSVSTRLVRDCKSFTNKYVRLLRWDPIVLEDFKGTFLILTIQTFFRKRAI